jgi:hypothetical protein
MLKAALINKNLIGQALAERGEYEEYYLVTMDWRLVAALVWMLGPMKKVSTAIGGSKYVTLSFAWTSMRALAVVSLTHRVLV